jgi:hypothetical protein
MTLFGRVRDLPRNHEIHPAIFGDGRKLTVKLKFSAPIQELNEEPTSRRADEPTSRRAKGQAGAKKSC